MSTELRNRLAQIVADAIEWDFDDSEYEGYGGDAARYWAADRILSDPLIERWREIAEQEPVAWDVYVGAEHAAHLRNEAKAADVAEVLGGRVVPLVPLTTAPSEP